MELQLLLILAIPLVLLKFLLQKPRDKQNGLHPPGPRGLPIIGNLHHLDNSSPHIHLWRLSQKYGPLMSLRLGCRPAIVISSAKIAKEALKTNDIAFSGRPALIGQQKMSYNGSDLAFAPYGDYWREIRKICVVHLFSTKRVQAFHSVREYEVSRTIETISRCASSREVVNLSEVLMFLTTSMICRVAFGKRYEDGGGERTKFHRLLNETQAMMGSFFVSDYVPSLGWFDKITGMLSRLDRSFKEMDSFCQEIIDDHLDPKRPKPDQEDFTDVLLRLRKDPLLPIDLTFDQIKAVLMIIFVGGSDTSAATVVWAMMELVRNPEVLKKAQEEIRKLTGKKRMINEEDLDKFLYLKAVVKETFRLHPIAPLLIPRETIQKCTLDGYEIQPKTLVYVNGWAIGRDPESWENPDKFLPERFMGSSVDFKGQDFELIPFGAGRRGCPGLYLGVASVELTLANLLYSFDWEIPLGMKKEDFNTDVIPGLTMHKKIPLCLLPRNYKNE